jgi:hypothetical protein
MARESPTEIPVQNGERFAGTWETERDSYPHFAVVIKETACTLFYYELEADHTPRGLIPLVRDGSVVRSDEFKVAEKQEAPDGAVVFRHNLYGFEYKKWSGKALRQCTWE